MARGVSGAEQRPISSAYIGLAFARQLVEMHGGSIEVTSADLHHGSKFVVRLPLTELVPQALAAHETGDEASSGTRRVLIVDDNADAANALRLLIETLGHSAQVAYEGHEALRRVEDFDPDVVLLDLGLPGMDGVEVAERIRSRHAGRSIVLVQVTGWTGRGGPGRPPSERSDLFDERLTKPVDAAQLKAAIEAPS